MSRKSLNPLALHRPKSTARRIVWKGLGDNDGVVVDIVMKPLTDVDSVYLDKDTNDNIAKYVTGSTEKIDGKEKHILPEPIAPLGGETVIVTKGACRIIAMLMTCQVGDPDELYSFQEWAHILCIPEFQRASVKLSAGDLIDELMEDPDWLNEESTDPLASTGDGGSASSHTSQKSSEPIQKSPIEQTAS